MRKNANNATIPPIPMTPPTTPPIIAPTGVDRALPFAELEDPVLTGEETEPDSVVLEAERVNVFSGLFVSIVSGWSGSVFLSVAIKSKNQLNEPPSIFARLKLNLLLYCSNPEWAE